MIINLPGTPVVGQRFRAVDAQRMDDTLRAQRLIAGDGVRIDYTPGGSVVSATGWGSGSSASSSLYDMPWDCEIKSSRADATSPLIYTAMLYRCYYWRGGNLYGQPALSVALPNDAMSGATRVLACRISLDGNTPTVIVAEAVEGGVASTGGEPHYDIPLYILALSGSAWRITTDLRSIPQIMMYS